MYKFSKRFETANFKMFLCSKIVGYCNVTPCLRYICTNFSGKPTTPTLTLICKVLEIFHPKCVSRRLFVSQSVSLFTSSLTYCRTMVLGVDSASNRNEYQEYFLRVKAAGA